MIEAFKQKALKLQKLTYQEASELSKIVDKEALYKAADEIRQQFCKNVIDLCSITNAKSGKCTQDCKWCPQSVHHTSSIEEYEIVDGKRAVNEALNNAQQGVAHHSLVTSGSRVSDKTLDNLIPIYREIMRHSSIGLCASMGLINARQMQRLKGEANVQRYHCNLETTPSFFSNLVSTHTIENKIETIKLAQKTGLEVCSGGIIGMGETMAQRIELAITLRDLDIQSIPINILNPMKGTPLQDMAPLNEEEVLTTIAIFRFINPTAQLRFAGGRMQIKTFQHKALRAGISAALTGNYLTSTGSSIKDDIEDFTNAGFTIRNGNQ